MVNWLCRRAKKKPLFLVILLRPKSLSQAIEERAKDKEWPGCQGTAAVDFTSLALGQMATGYPKKTVW